MLVSAVTKRRPEARKLLDSTHELCTNEYALKEVRRILTTRFGATPHEANQSIDELRIRCKVLPTPQERDVEKIILSDKSDSRIVAGAMQANAILVTEDNKTRLQAKKYVESKKPEEIIAK